MNNRHYKECEQILASERAKQANAKTKKERDALAEIVANIEKYLANFSRDSGAYARIKEIANRQNGSLKTYYASAGKKQNTLKYRDENGVIKNIPFEDKINGGRVEILYKKNAKKFVVYTLDYSNSNGKIALPPMVIPTTVFLAVLEKYDLLKMTNGKQPERAIQCTKKALREWLSDYYMPYDKDAIYCADDFEDIEI